MNDKPLIPWFIAKCDGKMLAAHCDCMAGLGETCSHVATLLWAIATGVEKRSSLTVTQKSAYWVMPPAIKSVPYQPIGEINFVGKKRKCSHSSTREIHSDARPKKHVPAVSSMDSEQLFRALSSCEGAKPAVLAAVPPYCEAYIPATLAEDLPMVLSELYKNEHLTLGYHSLLQLAKNTTLTVTAEQAKAVETKTRAQSNSRIWFRMRAGRITGSKFKTACHTDPASPSKSLIMSVCYPELFKYSSTATKWGCQHENIALEIYSHRSEHEGLKVSKCGLFISTAYPFLGASPDGIVECLCCGTGICEVKVSFTAQ